MDAKEEIQNLNYVDNDKGRSMEPMDSPTNQSTSQDGMDEWEKMWKLGTDKWQQIRDEDRAERMENGECKMEKWRKAYEKENMEEDEQ